MYLLRNPNSLSNTYATLRIFSSSNLFPINCIPIGIPLASTPHGIDIPGRPAIFTETVQISAKYISKGLFDLVPISNATVGDVGVKVIDDRNQLQNDGVVIIGMTIDGKTREIVANTDVQTRGFIYLKDSENVVKGIMNIAETELESYKNKTEEDIRDVRQNIKDKVNKYIIKETGKRPVILPVIIEL